MIFPLVALVLLMPIFMLYTGWSSDGGNSFFELADRASGSKSVLYAVCGAILLSIILNKSQGIMGVREMVDVVLKGMSGMLPLR